MKLLSTAIAGSVALCMSTLAATPAPARLPLHKVTADGTWDCMDLAGTFKGTIVVAEKTYAFIKTDGTLGGYGTLYLLTEDRKLPLFVIISGYMQDELGASGLEMRGPRGNINDVSGELYLNAIVSTEDDTNWTCARRERI